MLENGQYRYNYHQISDCLNNPVGVVKFSSVQVTDRNKSPILLVSQIFALLGKEFNILIPSHER